MSNALEGESYCSNHQGNHSHYAIHNCTVCKLIEENKRIKKILNTVTQDPFSIFLTKNTKNLLKE